MNYIKRSVFSMFKRKYKAFELNLDHGGMITFELSKEEKLINYTRFIYMLHLCNGL